MEFRFSPFALRFFHANPKAAKIMSINLMPMNGTINPPTP